MTDTQTAALTFEVAGLPPIKNEALSLFSVGHRQAPRVRALLLAACRAVQHSGWTPLAGPVALQVVLRCPGGHHGDATNFLGGIADVLQDKRHTGQAGLGHLGALADIVLYRADSQIRQLTFREQEADEPSYTVRVSALEGDHA